MPSSFLRYAVVLGLLTAIGPFAIDMYLPSLPTIGASLDADIGAVQLSLLVFFVALAVGQLFYGPLADMVGRKPPLYLGLGLFLAGSIGCALAPDIGTLNAFRFLQGLGGAAGMVVARAVVRDLHTGAQAARMMSLLMLVFGVSPILAPLVGGLVIEIADWRAIFWIVAVFAVLGLGMLAGLLPETRPPEDRAGSTIRSALASYRRLLGDRTFLGLTFIGSFGISGFFVFLANSSFVLIDHYGLSPALYGLAFAVNAIAFFATAQLNGWLVSRYGLARLVRTAVPGYAAAMVLLSLLAVAGVDRLDVLMVLMFVGAGFLGLVVPTTAVLALEDHGADAGTASALMGTLQLVTGAVMIAGVGPFTDGTALPMVLGMGVCALATYAFTLGTLRRARPAAVAAE